VGWTESCVEPTRGKESGMKQWEEEAIGGMQEEGEHILVNCRD